MSAADAAERTVREFFRALGDHDTEAMAELCSPSADVRYVPVETPVAQRSYRGVGKVNPVGRMLWSQLLDAFPDLEVVVERVVADGSGHVGAEVVVAGTQVKPFGLVAPRGKRFRLPQAFTFRIGDTGAIDSVAAYWCGADWNRQLGWFEVH